MEKVIGLPKVEEPTHGRVASLSRDPGPVDMRAELCRHTASTQGWYLGSELAGRCLKPTPGVLSP